MYEIRLKIFNPQPIPYNIDLFNAVYEHPGLDLKVVYLFKSDIANQAFKELPPQHFPHKFLPGIMIGESSCNIGMLLEVLKDDYDILLFCGYSYPAFYEGILLSALLRKRWLFWSDTWKHQWSKNLFIRVSRKLILKILFKYSQKILCTGLAGVESVKRFGASESLVESLPYFVSLDYLRNSVKSSLVNELIQWKNNRICFLFVGQLIERKGCHLLIEALLEIEEEVMDNACFIIAGIGPLESELREKVDKFELGQQIIFPGFVQPSELSSYLKAADVFILPSLWEAWGVVITEAMIMGKMILASNMCVSALDRVQHGVNGYLFNPKVNEIRKTIEHVIQNRELIHKMGDESARIADLWPPSRGAEILYQVCYESCHQCSS